MNSSRVRGRLPIVTAFALLVLLASAGQAAPAPMLPPRPPGASIADLAADDEAGRFDAILDLIAATDAGIDRLLDQARETAPFRESSLARAALEFVHLKRRNESAGRRPAKPQSGTSVVLISLDTVRADRLGAYGYHRKTSPSIDEIARRGAVFERAISPSSWTLPVHTSILTSRYPSFHGVERSGARWNVPIPATQQTMAERLKAAGFVTAGFVSNAYLDARWGFDRGFDVYRRYETGAEEQSRRASLWLQWHAYRVDRGLAGSSFLLFVHYNDAHGPYNVPEAIRRKFPVEKSSIDGEPAPVANCVTPRPPRSTAELDKSQALYDAEVNYLDSSLGRLFKALEDLGLRDSTFLVLTSDHGEEFGDHGGIKHKLTLYEEVIRVPLIMSFPREIAPRQRVQTPVSLLDILPTVLEAAGQQAPPGLHGISLLPHLQHNASGPRAPPPGPRLLFAELGPLGLVWDMPVYRKMVTSDEYKLIASYSRNGAVTRELYHLAADPRERCNAYEALREAPFVRQLEERLDEFVRDGLAYREANTAEEGFELDGELRDQLRSLGYIH